MIACCKFVVTCWAGRAVAASRRVRAVGLLHARMCNYLLPAASELCALWHCTRADAVFRGSALLRWRVYVSDKLCDATSVAQVVRHRACCTHLPQCATPALRAPVAERGARFACARAGGGQRDAVPAPRLQDGDMVGGDCRAGHV
eukprot:227243-Chlamydomonas_euryale.AAC.13